MPAVYLEGFDNETLYSEDSPFAIDYSKYSLVIVPIQKSKNIGKLKSRVVEVTKTGNEAKLNFSVFGTLYYVKLNTQKMDLMIQNSQKRF